VYEYCAWRVVSVAMRLPEMGYPLHGHDVRVTVCLRGGARVDVERVKRIIWEALEAFDHAPLWERAPPGMVEDLLERACAAVRDAAQGLGLEPVTAEAEIPGARIRVPCARA